MSVFVPARFVSDSIEAIYTAPTAQIIDKFTLNNTTATAVTVKVYVGGSDISQLTLEVPVQPKQSYLCGELVGHDLNAGEQIYAIADTAMAVSVRAGGRSR